MWESQRFTALIKAVQVQGQIETRLKDYVPENTLTAECA